LREGAPTAITPFDWGVASRALPGQRDSGDLWLVKPADEGVLVAVVDALGHGTEAASAARIAISALERYSNDPLPLLLQRCHTALVGTRGVVLSLAQFNPARATMTWLGVGNVEGVLLAADPGARPSRTSLVTRAGIVGAEVTHLQPWVVPLSAGDTLLFATDGIRSGFWEDASGPEPPQALAERILSRFAKDTDDALVLAVRYRGAP
jgi:hypothetical protein